MNGLCTIAWQSEAQDYAETALLNMTGFNFDVKPAALEPFRGRLTAVVRDEATGLMKLRFVKLNEDYTVPAFGTQEIIQLDPYDDMLRMEMT